MSAAKCGSFIRERSPGFRCAHPGYLLFAAALPAAFRWNKGLIKLYARLMVHGKAHNAALIACARKLLIYANTVVQRGTPGTERSAMI